VFHFNDIDARYVDHQNAIAQCDELLSEYCETLGAQRVVICLTDKVNFRKQYDETYKSNRKDLAKPELLQWVKDYLATEYPSYTRPRLEADDVMGILAMRPSLLGKRYEGDEVIIVSEDKDMRTIPAKVYNPRRPELGVLKITEDEANQFMLYQVLVGDPTDGYKGCPGIGPENLYVKYLMEDAEPEEYWDVVVEAYASRGFTEQDAVDQARMAHILWDSSYNFKNQKVKLWEPYWL
jgi:DNA polymerase-1